MVMVKDVYLTKDLYEASLLYASHKKLLGLKEENNYYWFIFADKVICKSLINAFWRREAQVNAKEYADALRSLKDRVFSQRREIEVNK